MSNVDIELRRRLGTERCDRTEIKCENRVARGDAEGSYEADPGHIELMTRSLGLQEPMMAGTPSAKAPRTPQLQATGLAMKTWRSPRVQLR